jgi:hypothetical protein
MVEYDDPFDALQSFVNEHEPCGITVEIHAPVMLDDHGTFQLTSVCPLCCASRTVEIDDETNTAHCFKLATLAGYQGSLDTFSDLMGTEGFDEAFERLIEGSSAVRELFNAQSASYDKAAPRH